MLSLLHNLAVGPLQYKIEGDDIRPGLASLLERIGLGQSQLQGQPRVWTSGHRYQDCGRGSTPPQARHRQITRRILGQQIDDGAKGLLLTRNVSRPAHNHQIRITFPRGTDD